MRAWLGRTLFAALFLSVALAPVRAVDTGGTTLEADLAAGMAQSIIESFGREKAAPPSLVAFEDLYLSFDTVRKWQAFIDAATAAKLPTSAGPAAKITAALATLNAGGVDQAGLAGAALSQLDAIADWSSQDKSQRELVTLQLDTLLATVPDAQHQVSGHVLLARIELGSSLEAAARHNLSTAIAELSGVGDPTARLQLARQLGTAVLALKDDKILELVSEIVVALPLAADRAVLVNEMTPRLASLEAPRLQASGTDTAKSVASDRLAFAWSVSVTADTTTAPFDAIVESVDQLPVAILFARTPDASDRRATCQSLVGKLVAEGLAIRALSLRHLIPVDDCPPATDLTLASAFAASHLGAMADAALTAFLDALDGGYRPTSDEAAALANALEALGAPGLITAHSTSLQALFGTGYTTLLGRTVVEALLSAPDAVRAKIASDTASLVANGTSAAAMVQLLGTGSVPAAVPYTPSDLPLLGAIGVALSDVPSAQERLARFVAGDSDVSARLAVAHGLTSTLGAHRGEGPLGSALTALADKTHDLALSAWRGTLDPTAAAADPSADDLLTRLARAKAWGGDLRAASDIATRVADRSAIDADIAAIQAVTGGMDAGMTALRSVDSAGLRTAAFRFVAEHRLAQLDVNGWFGRVARPAPNASAALISALDVVSEDTAQMSLTTSGMPASPIAPRLPNLGVASADVTDLVPPPTGGEAALVAGGEGRFVRLARFESPNFEGDRGTGVRDYLFHQTGTITPQFVFLGSGVFTLADIVAAIGRDQSDVLTDLPGGIVRINRPISIGPDATLVLSGQEAREIELNAQLGAYIVNAGQLFIVGTRVVGFDPATSALTYIADGQPATHFRPFILSWSGSHTYAADSEFVALGYSSGRSYGFSLTSGPADGVFARQTIAPPTGVVVNNSFDNLYYGFYAFGAAGAQVVGNEYRNSVIYGIDPHDRSRDLNLSLNATYGSFKKHGIIISREVDDSFIVGNLSFGNHGSGVMLDRNSVGTVVVGNTLRGNEGDGMAVFESPCTLIGMNDISANGRSGVLVRNSWDVTVADNQITANKRAGVTGLISDLTRAGGSQGRNFVEDPYQPFATLDINRNLIESNGAGVQTAGVSAVQIYGNQFIHQLHRLFAGDLDGLKAPLLQNGKRVSSTVAAACQPVLVPPHACDLTASGAVFPQGASFGTAPRGDYCVAGSGTVQAAAFAVGAH